MNLGIQLYSLRDIIKDAVPQTLKQVSEMGYTEVELAGRYGLSASEFKALLDSCGLKAVSTHIGVGDLGDKFDAELEYCLSLGVKDFILAWSDVSTAEDCKKIADMLNNASLKAAKAGAFVGYHNHGHEFSRTDGGKRMIDILADETDKAVCMEFDVYWVTYGGGDPEEYIKKYAGRERLMHLKEMSKDEPMRNVEIGDGRIDFAKLITLGKDIGVKHFIVEQEAYTMPVAESCARSFKGIEKLKVL